jgi:hypothetical protein
MPHRSTPWKHFLDQIRLACAEKLMMWAMRLAPRDHPDSVAILQGVAHMAKRRPAVVVWRGGQTRR